MSRPAVQLVIDASIAAKWFLYDEQFANEATELLRAYRSGLVELYAPLHIQ